ncbi:hypothetical protein DXG01_008378, partial [Tephrocybe rancida]
MSRTHSKLYTLTLDNTSANDTCCTEIELPPWPASENQLPCLEHVTNLATVDVMGHITKIKAIDTTSAIWDYSPGDDVNRVLDGCIDVIATIRTLAIKLECGFQTTLKLTLHNNTRWGSAFNMLERALKLRSAINLFVVHADQLYGPITTQQTNGHITKKIPWTDFSLNDADWALVEDAKAMLADSNCVLHYFSSEKQPTLWRALPALENLQTEWEDKLFKHRWALFHAAIRAGLAKLIKYYTKFDHKPVYILALFLHPYFKLHYIQIAWGGPEEQKAEFDKGNFDVKDWVDEARKIVENVADDNTSFTSEFDRHRRTLITQNHDDEWQAELRHYLKSVPADVDADTDIVEWWS